MSTVYATLSPEEQKLVDQFTQAVTKSGSEELLSKVKLEAMGAIARSGVSLEAYKHLHWCLSNHDLAPHAEQVWIPKLVQAYHRRTGVLLEGFRGSGKSATLIYWVLLVTGINPVGNTVLVRISDKAAIESSKAIATIIENSPGWKACFPYIVPDKQRGWSTDGFHVMDLRVVKEDNSGYGKWIEMCTQDHLGEPSILAAGLTSDIIIGKHPSNGMYFDDLHNESNTRSAREMQAAVDIVRNDIVQTWSRPGPNPILGVACTLWSEKDAYHAMLETGRFEHVKTPIFILDPEGDIVYPGEFHHGERIRLTWPEMYPLEKVLAIESEELVQFPRSRLCDLSAMKGIVLKDEWLHSYPRDKINSTWPVYLGVDFASTEDKLHTDTRDYFAAAVGVGIPGGGLVLIDGIREHLSSAEALQRVQALRSQYPTLVAIGVEKWGKGEEFKNDLIYGMGLPVLPCPIEGRPVQSKGQRFQAEGGLAPLFFNSRLWISDIETDFIRYFRDEWIGWDGGRSRTGHDDCLDAVYWMAYVAQQHLILPPISSDLTYNKNVPIEDPWLSLKHHKGYGRSR